MARVHLLGCGVIGTLVGTRLQAHGHTVVGVRRTVSAASSTDRSANFPLLTGDVADPTLHDRLGPADAVLLAANPGVRRRARERDGGNGLEHAATLIAERYPTARIVYTGTTSVYADAKGTAVDEGGQVAATDPEVAALLAIEAPLLAMEHALVLRVAAIVGPSRQQARERIRRAAADGSPVIVRGDPQRPFSWVHELDLAELCADELVRPTLDGLRNVAAAGILTVRGYYLELAKALGVSVPLIGDGTDQPNRAIRATSAITARLARPPVP